MKRSFSGGMAAVAAALLLAACGGGDAGSGGGATPGEMAKQANGSGGGITLTGAGATFPYPIYSKWFSEYGKANPLRVNYQSIGSGGGIRQVTEGTVDFGASDAPMNDEELAKAPGMLHIPTVLGSIAVTYNLPGITQPLRLDGPAVAGLFMGRIAKWNDPAIAALNPGVTLPDQDVIPVYRTDGSGTTYVFTDYLGAVSPEWKQSVGVGKSVSWPEGLGAKGNEGVTGAIKQTPGSVGYVELAYATQNQLPAAALRNAGGQFVQPTVESTAAAAENLGAAIGQHPDFRLSLVNQAGAQTYPITSWTYLLVPPHLQDCAKANALAGLVRWTLADGDQFARDLHYAPLPPAIEQQVLDHLAKLTCGPNRQAVGLG
jgi:phosphate transport system substrate-binding protein